MAWYRYLKYGETTSSTVISNNYQYPNVRRKIVFSNPLDDIDENTWVFVNLNELKIDKIFNSNLELETQNRSFLVVYHTDASDDYVYKPVETMILGNLLYFSTAEKHFAEKPIQKNYYIYYKTKNIKNISPVTNRNSKRLCRS